MMTINCHNLRVSVTKFEYGDGVTLVRRCVTMTIEDMRQVQKWVSNGGKLLIGRDHAGRQKIKITHGPLHVFTHRFSVTDDELNELKQMLNLAHQSAA
jgi:hypothetical protein